MTQDNRISAQKRSGPAASRGPIRILIVEDHPLAADGLRTYLSVDDELEVIGVCPRGDSAIELAEQANPDLVILDLELTGSQVSGVDVARLLHARSRRTRVLVVTAHAEENFVMAAFQSNIHGYVLKTSQKNELIRAAHAVAAGQSVYDDEVMDVVNRYLHIPENAATIAPFDPLTEREWEVLRLVAAGYSNEEIALALNIALRTVKAHVGSILSKLGVADRRQAAVYYRSRLMQDDPVNRGAGAAGTAPK